MQGSCLCGSVRYEITAPFAEVHHCHCSRCRKAHGAAFSTFGQASTDTLRVVAGQDTLRSYRSSPPVERSFCGTCGSSLLFRTGALPDAVWVALGTLDDTPSDRPQAHIFVGSRAPWHDIVDDLPQFAEYPPQEE